MENVREILENGEAVLGLEFGSTRIKAVLIDREHRPIASGDFEWENRLEEGIWTYRLDDIWEGLQGCYQKKHKPMPSRHKNTSFSKEAVFFNI